MGKEGHKAHIQHTGLQTPPFLWKFESAGERLLVSLPCFQVSNIFVSLATEGNALFSRRLCEGFCKMRYFISDGEQAQNPSSAS